MPKTAKLDEGKGLLFRKGVFPYEYIDSWRKYEDQNLPPKEAFYDALHKKEIKDSEHEYAKKVWEEFGCKTLGDYSDLYLKTDVALLADIFENFRKLGIKIYGLDPLNYPTAPSFAWDALLQKTKVELELLTDIDMHLMIEKGMRGRVTVATKRFAKANNKYLKDYDPTKPSTYIMYYDANNLYGCAMVDMLPKDGFRWMQELPTEEEIMRKTANHPKGWILKVDLLYPKELHDEHNDFPLAPEIRRVMEEEYSDWQKNCMAKLGQKPTKSKKLMMDFLPKRDYVVHYKNLQHYIAHGMKLIRVKSAIEFNQEKWMKDYIEMNTEKRQKAKNEFEKDFFKLMNNAVFGKTMENKRNRMDLQIFNKNTQNNKIVKQVASPFFEKQIMFPNGFVGIVKRQSEVFLNKPIYTGMTILDNSKLVMYRRHYELQKRKYGEKSESMYSDTDSDVVKVETDDIYKDMQGDDAFDTSNYPKENPLHSDKNKKVLGKMKDEKGGVVMKEFCAIKAKMYSFLDEGLSETKKAKGVTGTTLQNIQHEDFKNAVFNQEEAFHVMEMIRSENHEIHTILQKKKTLNPMDTKRYILEDGINTRAYGHWRTEEENKKKAAACLEEYL